MRFQQIIKVHVILTGDIPILTGDNSVLTHDNMKPYLKTVQTTIDNVIDSETGELIESLHKTIDIVVAGKEQFFLVYSHIMTVLCELHGQDIRLIAYVMFKEINERGRFANSEEFRRTAATYLKVSTNTVSRSIKKLVEQEVVTKTGSRGIYQVSPTYFWKGSSELRKNEMKLTLSIKTRPMKGILDELESN